MSGSETASLRMSMWSSYLIEHPPEEMVKTFAGRGWKFSELSSEHARMLLERGDPGKTGRRFRKFAEDNGFCFPQGHLYIAADIANPDESSRLKDMENLKRYSELFSAVGITAGVLHPGGANLAKNGASNENILELNIEPLAELLEFNRGGPVSICLENMLTFATTPDEIMSMVDYFPGENLSVCLDTGHLNITGGDCAGFVRRAGGKLKALHVHDSIGAEHDHIFPYGRGTIKWDDFIEALKSENYGGIFNFEVPGESKCPMDVKLAKLNYALELGKLMDASGRPRG